MRINWVNAIIATVIAGLLAWWLWIMGLETFQKWLLAGLGGGVIEIGLLGSMGFNYDNPRSGAQVRIVFSLLAVCVFIASCIYSFFYFSPEGYCIPVGIFALLLTLLGVKIYQTKE